MQQPKATGLHRCVERQTRRKFEERRDRIEIEERLVVEHRKAPHHSREVEIGFAGDIVLGDETAVVLDPAHQLLELEQHEATIGAELDDIVLDFVGEPPDHLGPLQDRCDVTDCDEVLHFERRKGRTHRVEPRLVALEDLEGLIGACQDTGRRIDGALLSDHVDRDLGAVLGHGDHGYRDLLRDALGSSVARPGL